MGNHFSLLRKYMNLSYLTEKFLRHRGKKRRHSYFNSSNMNSLNQIDLNYDEFEDSDSDDIDSNDDDNDDDDLGTEYEDVDDEDEDDSSVQPRSHLNQNTSSATQSNPNNQNSNTTLRAHRQKSSFLRNYSSVTSGVNSKLKPSFKSPISSSSTADSCASTSAASLFRNNRIDSKLRKPARKKMRSTTQYVYNILFLKGENSDLTVKALGKEWCLHKIYLCQSPYFDSMFKNGSKWKESTQACIEIEIPDKNITERSLFISFGSFYNEHIEIAPLEVISVLACASLFSLDGLIGQCEIIMCENITYKTVYDYYDASIMYGVKQVTESIIKWFCSNLMTNNDLILADLKQPLLEKVLANYDLMIIKVETDLYTLCKKWLYFQLNKQNYNSKQTKFDRDWQKICNEYFKSLLLDDPTIDDSNSCSNPSTSTSSLTSSNRNKTYNKTSTIHLKKSKRTCLLDKPAYKKYAPIFKKIRLQHILTDMASLNILYSDQIIPHEWIEPFYFKNWINTLYIDQDQLSHEFQLSRNDFEKFSARFGRTLTDDSTAIWRWVGFNYGIDLLVSHTNRNITLQRNTMHIVTPYKGLLSNKPIQRVYYIMKVVQLDQFGYEKWSKKTDLTCIDLNRNEEKFVLNIDNSDKYPIILSLHVATHQCSNTLSLINNIYS